MAFIIEKSGVAFSIPAESSPLEKDGLYSLVVAGEIPVPTLVKGDRLLLPIDEGIALTVEEEYENGEFNFAHIRHKFCSREGTMSMVIVQRGDVFLLITLESGLHAFYEVQKEEGIYQLAMHTRKPCRVFYKIFGDLLSACKGYREIKGITPVPLTKKIQDNPNLSQLVGGGIFWIWNHHYDEVMYSDHDVTVNPQTGEDLMRVAERLKAGGVNKALFGIFFAKDNDYVEPLYKTFGYLATQYDNYNDVLNPELLSRIPNNRVRSCDYTARRMKDYPDGVALLENGKMSEAWALKGFDGKMYSQNSLCPLVAKERMTTEVKEILAQYPYYKGRFVDVYGCDVAECYHPAHPVTREEGLSVKRQAFDNLKAMGLLVGTEDGFEDLVDSLDYTEGLHSPVYFRNHNAGRRHANMYNDEEKRHIEKHMLNPRCRVPLWHLVYHECMPAFPYWGDTIDDAIDQMQDKILFACLYGCPPLYSFQAMDFDRLEDHILRSYKAITAIHEKVATLPITAYEVLNGDYSLQTTVFGDKYRVVANFSTNEQVYEGRRIPPKDVVCIEL